MEHPIKIDDLGVPLFLETPICSVCFFCEAPRSFSVFSKKTKKHAGVSCFHCHQCFQVSGQTPRFVGDSVGSNTHTHTQRQLVRG